MNLNPDMTYRQYQRMLAQDYLNTYKPNFGVKRVEMNCEQLSAFDLDGRSYREYRLDMVAPFVVPKGKKQRMGVPTGFHTKFNIDLCERMQEEDAKVDWMDGVNRLCRELRCQAPRVAELTEMNAEHVARLARGDVEKPNNKKALAELICGDVPRHNVKRLFY